MIIVHINIKGYDVTGLVETHLRDSFPSPLDEYKIHMQGEILAV